MNRAALAVAAGTAVALTLAAGLESDQRQREQGRFRLVPDLGYVPTHEEGAERRGWDEEATPPPGGDRRRIAFVGDSVTFGLGLPARRAWPAVVGEALGVEALNFGVVGWDAEQVATLVSTRLEVWRPDVLVWGTYANDVFPTSVLYASASGDPVFVGRTVPAGARLVPSRLEGRFLDHSALFRRAQAAAYLRWQATSAPPPTRPWYAAQVQRIAGWARAREVPLVVLAIPPHVLAGECGADWICAEGPGWYAEVTDVLAASGVAWVDGLTAWRGRGPFFQPGGHDVDHPNDEGHRLLAEAVTPLIARTLGPREDMDPARASGAPPPPTGPLPHVGARVAP